MHLEKQQVWLCRREDSNLQGLLHTILSRARIPFRHFGYSLRTACSGIVPQVSKLFDTIPIPMWFSSTPITPYIHKVSPRAKRIKLSVSRLGEVIVTSPRFVPKLLIDRFVSQNQTWIEKAKTKLTDKTQRISNSEALLFGTRYSIHTAFDKSARIGLQLVDKEMYFNPVHDTSISTNKAAIQKSLATHLDRYYKNTITEYIGHRLPLLAKQMGVTYSKIQIREQKTRWGSCSSTGALSFNWRLVHHPPAVIEYVLIHELAHRREMNHSKAFWDIVRTHCPEYPKHRGWLKRTQVAED